MAIAWVQSNVAVLAASGQTIAFTNPNGTGNLLIAIFINNTIGASFSIVDTNSNSWNQVGIPISGASRTMQILYAMNSKPGTNTLTVTIPGFGSACEAFVGEYSGVALTGALDQSTNSSTAGSSGDAVSSGNVNTGVANELLVTAMFNNTGVTIAAAGNTPNIRENPNTVHAYADGIAGVAGSYAGQFTINNISAVWVCALATFKPLVSGGGGMNGSGLLRLLGVD